jgi:hypothetical protein
MPSLHQLSVASCGMVLRFVKVTFTGSDHRG